MRRITKTIIYITLCVGITLGTLFAVAVSQHNGKVQGVQMTINVLEKLCKTKEIFTINNVDYYCKRITRQNII